MNYYEHHIRAFAQATSHLNLTERGAYQLLICKYYAKEQPLPCNIKVIQRLVRARTKSERNAVETVLEEFFVLQDDGWHNTRCDEEIARYHEGDEERALRAENEGEELL